MLETHRTVCFPKGVNREGVKDLLNSRSTINSIGSVIGTISDRISIKVWTSQLSRWLHRRVRVVISDCLPDPVALATHWVNTVHRRVERAAWTLDSIEISNYNSLSLSLSLSLSPSLASLCPSLILLHFWRGWLMRVFFSIHVPCVLFYRCSRRILTHQKHQRSKQAQAKLHTIRLLSFSNSMTRVLLFREISLEPWEKRETGKEKQTGEWTLRNGSNVNREKNSYTRPRQKSFRNFRYNELDVPNFCMMQCLLSYIDFLNSFSEWITVCKNLYEAREGFSFLSREIIDLCNMNGVI